MNELKLKTSEFTIKYDYSKSLTNCVNINDIIKKLKKIYNGEHCTFKDFFIKHLGKKIYEEFKKCNPYSDYEYEDIYDTLYYYGMDDNSCCSTGFTVPWKDLIKKLSEKVGKEKIKMNREVLKIFENNQSNNYKYKIIAKNDNNKEFYYYSKKIIIASTINTIKKLLPNYKIYNEIHSQPFLRIYGKFSKKSLFTIQFMSSFSFIKRVCKFINFFKLFPNLLMSNS